MPTCQLRARRRPRLTSRRRSTSWPSWSSCCSSSRETRSSRSGSSPRRRTARCSGALRQRPLYRDPTSRNLTRVQALDSAAPGLAEHGTSWPQGPLPPPSASCLPAPRRCGLTLRYFVGWPPSASEAQPSAPNRPSQAPCLPRRRCWVPARWPEGSGCPRAPQGWMRPPKIATESTPRVASGDLGAGCQTCRRVGGRGRRGLDLRCLTLCSLCSLSSLLLCAAACV
mmetsp:Transcript_6242/g.15753  ORF Transcript_6242/g.15753 Transcript_6242/m.15753 type:complete len:226 (+) Transcript_6242:341-1018(+)